jgi:hypothetical protein
MILQLKRLVTVSSNQVVGTIDRQKVTPQPMASQVMRNRVDSGNILKCLRICFAEIPEIHGSSKDGYHARIHLDTSLLLTF